MNRALFVVLATVAPVIPGAAGADTTNASTEGARATNVPSLDSDAGEHVRCGPEACEIDRATLLRLLANSRALETGPRFVPVSGEGRPSGFRIFAIRPGSVLARLGFTNGDLVTEVNGAPMATPKAMLRAYHKLKKVSKLAVVVVRNGATETVEIRIRRGKDREPKRGARAER